MGRKNDGQDGMWLGPNADPRRLRDAENARKNRAEITKALSHGQISRRDLVKWGLFTSAGIMAPIGGLNPFVSVTQRAGCHSCRQQRLQSNSHRAARQSYLQPAALHPGDATFRCVAAERSFYPEPSTAGAVQPDTTAGRSQSGRRANRIDRTDRRPSPGRQLGPSGICSIPAAGGS